MRRIIVAMILLLFTSPVFSEPVVETPMIFQNAKPIEAGVSFDWISKTQLQRDENIKQIQMLLFDEKTVFKYPKKEFKAKYADFWKNKNFLTDYEDISNGKKEDSTKNYCGFFWKKMLVAYGIQYKNNLVNIYYYDALGNLRWLDMFSKNYPTFPYWAYQYDRSGEMVAAYYYLSSYDQYIFKPNKKFSGRWYKDKMYNRNAKVIMTRSNWD